MPWLRGPKGKTPKAQQTVLRAHPPRRRLSQRGDPSSPRTGLKNQPKVPLARDLSAEKTLLTPETRGKPGWESQLSKAREGLPTRPRAKYARRPKETARPIAPARHEGHPLGAHARRTRGLEMGSVGLPRHPTRKETKANAEVEFIREEALASR